MTLYASPTDHGSLKPLSLRGRERSSILGCSSLRRTAALKWLAVVGAHHPKGTSMKTKIRALMASFIVASVTLMGVLSSARAADDKWFVLGEQTIKSTDPSATITSEGNRRDK